MGLRPHPSVSGKPLPSYGVGLFPTRLTCTGWEGCDSYSASDLGVYEAGDHVKVSISAAGAIQLHARGALIKTTDDGVAAGYDWYGIVALWTSGSWVDNVQLTYPQSPGEASWSSFAGAAGVRMPTEAPGARTCGTQYAGWLSTPHPAAGEPPTPGVVCFDADRGAAYKDCYLSAQVEVCACAVDGGATTFRTVKHTCSYPAPPHKVRMWCSSLGASTNLPAGKYSGVVASGTSSQCPRCTAAGSTVVRAACLAELVPGTGCVSRGQRYGHGAVRPGYPAHAAA